MTAVTIEWLREIARRGNHDFAESMAPALVRGDRFYTIEEYERAFSQVAERYPWMRLKTLKPWPWIPVNPDGTRRADSTQLVFGGPVSGLVASGLLTADMLPQGRKRTAYHGYDTPHEVRSINVRSQGGTLRVIAEICDDLDQSDAWSLFRPATIRDRDAALTGCQVVQISDYRSLH